MDNMRLYILSTVFQSYQDNERLIMKGCVQWNPVYSCEDIASRPVLNPLSYRGSIYFRRSKKFKVIAGLGVCTVMLSKCRWTCEQCRP